MNCTSDNVKFPECDNCIMVVKARRMPLLLEYSTLIHTYRASQNANNQ